MSGEEGVFSNMNEFLIRRRMTLNLTPLASNVVFEMSRIIFYVMDRGNVVFERPTVTSRLRSYLDLENDIHGRFYEVADSRPEIFAIRKVNPKRPIVFYHHPTEENICMILGAMENSYMAIELCHNARAFQECDLHLVDLYEMGYFSHHVVGTEMGPLEIFTGLDLMASKGEKSLEINMSSHVFYLHLAYHEKNAGLTRKIHAFLHELPFREEEDREGYKQQWEISNVLEISGLELFVPEFHYHYWWIKRLNKIFDYFDDYRMFWNFHGHLIPEIHIQSIGAPPPWSIEASSVSC